MKGKKTGALSDADKKLWERVTDNITALDSDRAARPLVRRSFYRMDGPDLTTYSQPAPALTDPSFTLRDRDHNWHQKLRRGKVKPEGRIDLHGMTEDRAYAALHRYIEEAQKRGKRFILVVTGKGGRRSGYEQMSHRDYSDGRGILKTNVPRWLSQGILATRIVSFHSANGEHGGEGALYVILKRNRGLGL